MSPLHEILLRYALMVCCLLVWLTILTGFTKLPEWAQQIIAMTVIIYIVGGIVYALFPA